MLRRYAPRLLVALLHLFRMVVRKIVFLERVCRNIEELLGSIAIIVEILLGALEAPCAPIQQAVKR
jgi:hypothetical protein